MREKEKIKKDVLAALNNQVSKEIIIVERPKDRRMGDFAVPCFEIAKRIKKSPNQIAMELAGKIKYGYRKVEAVSGYVNFHLKRHEVLKKIIANKNVENYGGLDYGYGETIVIDYSSPNIAKPFSVGHLRSTVIGNALRNICVKCGFEVVGINHLGDWGTQFGKLIIAFQKWGDADKMASDPINELTELYVRFHEEAEKDETLNEQARQVFWELENNNEEYLKLWRYFRDESLKEFQKTYDLLGINNFDSYDGEAFYNDKMTKVIDELKAKNLLTESEGAQVVMLDDMPPALIQKKDGATLYITRELATAFYRKAKYDFREALYVVGNEQQLHFKQMKEIIRKMGYSFADSMHHINFGMILQDGKKMSTRRGKTVKLHQVLLEAIDKVSEYTDDAVLKKQIGIGAVIFNDLKNYRTNDIEFNLDDILQFEGETGPYIQYTHARIQSLLANKKNMEIDYLKFDITDLMWHLLFKIYNFSQIIEKAQKDYDPSQLAKYVLTLAQDFNKFYAEERIIDENAEYQQFKLEICQAVAIVIKESLNLLGIEAPENM